MSRLLLVTSFKNDYNFAENDDYGPGPYNITFSAGVTVVTFDAPIINDSILEGDEEFLLVIDQASLPSCVIRGDPGAVVMRIVDDDSK